MKDWSIMSDKMILAANNNDIGSKVDSSSNCTRNAGGHNKGVNINGKDAIMTEVSVMGIINVNEESFYAASRCKGVDSFEERMNSMFAKLNTYEQEDVLGVFFFLLIEGNTKKII